MGFDPMRRAGDIASEGAKAPSNEGISTTLKVIAVAAVIALIISGVAAARFPVGSINFYSMVGTGGVALVVFTITAVSAVREYRNHKKELVESSPGGSPIASPVVPIASPVGEESASPHPSRSASPATTDSSDEISSRCSSSLSLGWGSYASTSSVAAEENFRENASSPESEMSSSANSPVGDEEWIQVEYPEDSLEAIVANWQSRIPDQSGYESDWEPFNPEDFDFSGRQFMKDVMRQKMLINGNPVLTKSKDEMIGTVNKSIADSGLDPASEEQILAHWQTIVDAESIRSIADIYRGLANQALAADCTKAMMDKYVVNRDNDKGILMQTASVFFNLCPSTDRVEMITIGEFFPWNSATGLKESLGTFEAHVVVNLQLGKVETRWQVTAPKLLGNPGIPYTIRVNGLPEVRYYQPEVLERSA